VCHTQFNSIRSMSLRTLVYNFINCYYTLVFCSVKQIKS
jgi:hypothetical protein